MSCNKPLYDAGWNAHSLSGLTIGSHTDNDEFSENITIPVFTNTEGIFPGLVAFLNGFASPKTLGELISDAWDSLGGDGTVTTTLNEDGQIEIALSMDATHTLNIVANPTNDYWGLPVNGVNIAPGNFVQGVSFFNQRNLVDTDDPSSGFNVIVLQRNGVGPFVQVSGYLWQNVPHAFKDYSDALADDLSLVTTGGLTWVSESNLTALEATPGASGDFVYWGLTEDGRVYRAGTLDWDWSLVGRVLARQLGFSGNEVSTLIEPDVGEDFYYLVADNKCPSVFTTKRGLIRRNIYTRREGSSQRTMNGGYSALHIGSYPGLETEVMLEGDALGSTEATHFIYDWNAQVHPGELVMFYQNWPETRIARRDARLEWQEDPQSVDYISTRTGNRGVLMTYYSDKNSQETTAIYDGATGLELLTRQTIFLDNVKNQLDR